MLSFFSSQVKKFQKNRNLNKLVVVRQRKFESWNLGGGLRKNILNPPSIQIPKTLFLYWSQGWEKSPEISKLCLEQWQKLNPDWNIKTLNKETASDLSDLDLDYYESKFTKQHCTDILRVRLLKKLGGVWADSAIWCQHPLSQFLPPLAVSGFFAFFRPSPEKIISSWFLASGKDNYLVDSYDSLIHSYIENRKTIDVYFFLHYLFEYLINTDKKADKIWRASPKISADAAHQVGNKMLESPPSPSMVNFINNKVAFMHKLNTRSNLYPKEFPNSVLSLLIGRDNLLK